MTAISRTHAAAFALALTLGADVALAQAAHEQHHPQTQPQAPMSGATTPSPGMIGPGMMQQMPPGMMGHGMMGQTEPGMMGHHAMMGQGAGPGMMGQLGTGIGGWSGLEGRRVVPMMQLSVDDVRIFLERYLESLGNARLKVGKVTEADNDTITAEILTVDDSLVETFAVDRHTGVISAAG
jgi:hypothetical protein